MADSKLSELPQGTLPGFAYGIDAAGASKKFHAHPALNVIDFGADPTGATDSTAAIQACFDAAFGPYSAPHGGALGNPLNRDVFFPSGFYNVSSPIQRTINGAVNNGGAIRLTVNSTSGWINGDPVLVAGVVGTTEANNDWFIDVVDATHVDLRQSNFFNAYVSGGTIKSPALKLRSVQGTKIFGAGRLSTFIQNQTADSNLIHTNGFSYSIVSDIAFAAASGGDAFDYDWMAFDTGATVSAQSNTFLNCNFGGNRYGLSIGAGQNMCSETTIINCFFGGNGTSTIGLGVRNFNALQQQVIGGNFQSCAIGIWILSGSVPVIHGVGFQNTTGRDIKNDNTVGDGFSISGCRSESQNFAEIRQGAGATISSCTQLNGSNGNFLFIEGGSGVFAGSACLLNNYSLHGDIQGNGEIFMHGNAFGNPNYLNINTVDAVVHALGNTLKDPSTVANLPPAARAFRCTRMTVIDSTVPGSGNFGAVVAGGGSNAVPVWCDGTAWRIG